MRYLASGGGRCGCCAIDGVIGVQMGMWGGGLRRVQPSLRWAEISDLVQTILDIVELSHRMGA